ncbi:MAG: hypothetical protein M1812_000380 [Candelaria pacifica]|nr:MAG: hypothetical protein M1812_000380 [Candelaria pacifica]
MERPHVSNASAPDPRASTEYIRFLRGIVQLLICLVFFNQFGVSVIRRGAVSQSSEPGYDRLENPQLLYSRVLNGLRFCTSDLTDHLNCKGVQLARELLGKATDYASRVSTEDQIILQSIKYFSMVMNIYCVFESKHRQKLLLPTLQLPTYDTFELQALARTTLEIILSELQAYLFARKKEHWVRTFYSFCIVLLAAEVTQMNMALDDLLSGLRGTQWVATSHAMERCVSEVLVPLFKTSNRGFDPLIMDMNKKSSVSLLDNDEATVEEYKRLQRTMASYKEFWDLHSIGPQVEERSGTLKPRITGRFIALLVSG